MNILHKRWVLILVLCLAFVFTTACSCTNLFAPKSIPTVVPTITPKPTVVVTPFVVPQKSGTAFEGEFSEEQLNSFLKDEIAKEAGDYVSDIQVSITSEAILATVQINASDLNIKFGVTVAGIPVVVEGKVYLKVTQITLDDKLSGWTRLTAKSLVQSMIDKYAGANGIPIDIKGIRIDEVELRPGKLYIKGKTL
jgi:hypothetical protein